ncbi:MAG: putative pilN [Parcubacteria group bacterium]|nr:putative pilN [Parcubacteria group bacterium]
MALPPTIPTSFVPKQPVSSQTRRISSGTNVFLLIGVVLFGISLAAAAAAFAYQKYLENVRDGEVAQLDSLQRNIDRSSVEDFIRLRNRFIAGQTLLDNHVGLSQFFNVLESITLQNVRFETLKLEVNPDHSASLGMEGHAATFNALAAQSTSFAGDKRIKRAIFSDIGTEKGGGVSFSLTADLSPEFVILSSFVTPPITTSNVVTPPPTSTTPAAKTTATTPVANPTTPVNAMPTATSTP